MKSSPFLKARLSRKSPEHLVLLDVGMVAELTRDDQLKFVDFFKVFSSAAVVAIGSLGFRTVGCCTAIDTVSLSRQRQTVQLVATGQCSCGHNANALNRRRSPPRTVWRSAGMC